MIDHERYINEETVRRIEEENVRMAYEQEQATLKLQQCISVAIDRGLGDVLNTRYYSKDILKAMDIGGLSGFSIDARVISLQHVKINAYDTFIAKDWKVPDLEYAIKGSYHIFECSHSEQGINIKAADDNLIVEYDSTDGVSLYEKDPRTYGEYLRIKFDKIESLLLETGELAWLKDEYVKRVQLNMVNIGSMTYERVHAFLAATKKFLDKTLDSMAQNSSADQPVVKTPIDEAIQVNGVVVIDDPTSKFIFVSFDYEEPIEFALGDVQNISADVAKELLRYADLGTEIKLSFVCIADSDFVAEPKSIKIISE